MASEKKINEEKIDEMYLALLHLTTYKDGGIARAWKGIDWDVSDRMFEKGWIYDPKGKAKSLALTEEGEKLSKELFWKIFGDE